MTTDKVATSGAPHVFVLVRLHASCDVSDGASVLHNLKLEDVRYRDPLSNIYASGKYERWNMKGGKGTETNLHMCVLTPPGVAKFGFLFSVASTTHHSNFKLYILTE